jgi:hypothetical protein
VLRLGRWWRHSGFLALSVVGCSQGTELEGNRQNQSQESAFPERDGLPWPEAPRQRLRLGEGSEGWPSHPILDRLLATERLVIGGDSTSPFGAIGEVVPVGEFAAILDHADQRVRLIDSGGRIRHEVGGPGAGPGEFRQPLGAVLRESDGLIVVADVMRKLEVFRPVSGEVEHVGTYSIDFSATALCSMGDTVVGYGWAPREDGGPLRLLGKDFTPHSRIGDVYQSTNRMVDQSVARYRILCDAERSQILLAPRAGLPELYLVGTAGAGSIAGIIQWTDFLGPLVSIDSTGFSIAPNPAGIHRLHTLSLVGRDHALVQYGLVAPEEMRDPEAFSMLYTFLVDLAEFRVVGRSTALPPLVMINESFAMELIGGDWPAVGVRSLSHVGDGAP